MCDRASLSHALVHCAVLRLRGLPWDATKEHVQRFLSPVTSVTEEDIMLVRNLRGDAYVMLDSVEMTEKASSLHRQTVRASVCVWVVVVENFRCFGDTDW